MGCFTTACAVSARQIRYNEPIVAFAVAANKDRYDYDRPHSIYSFDKWSIVSMPLYGVYDDYGGISLDSIDTLAVKHLQSLFPQTNFLDSTYDPKQINHAFRRKEVAYDNKEYELGVMMIHRDVFNFILENYRPSGWEGALNRYLESLGSMDYEEEGIDHKEWMIRYNKRQVQSFNADRQSYSEFGKDDPEDWDEPNKLVALSSMSSTESPIHRLTKFYQMSHGENMEDTFVEQFDNWSQVVALSEACFNYGVQFVPSMYTGQDHTEEESLKFHLHNVKAILNKMAIDDYENGPRWDRKTDTETYRKDIFLAHARDMLIEATATFDHYHEKMKEYDDDLDD